MNKIGKLNFGQQIVPIKSEKPITPQEQADLVKVKKLLDEKIGKDVVTFQVKDPNNLDVIVNHPDPKVEKEIADRMREMSAATAPAKAPAANPKAAPAPAPKLNVVG